MALARGRRPLSGRARTAITIAGSVGVAAVLAVALAGKGSQFTAALHAAPLWVLALAVSLQIAALVTRSEAWRVCVHASGGTVARRRLFRASSVGYLAMIVNSQLAVAARIAALRRSAPRECPRVPALLAAELPIVAIEAVLAAVWSFTLVGPLGLPWWLPVVAFAAMASLTTGLCALARRHGGPWSGLAVLRSLDGRSRIIGLVLIAVLAQIARNWLVLRATGTPVSLLDSIAVLIAMVSISLLPVGPSVGAAATVLILGTHGVATVAAAGVLLTATGTAGALCFAGWALADWLVSGEHARTRSPRRRARATAAALCGALGALPAAQRRVVELAYFGGLDRVAVARMLQVPLVPVWAA
jgi:hypothetical protein